MALMVLRPFYVIGHNPNTLEDCRRFLEAGANGLEPDIQWDSDRNDLVVAHDPGDAGNAPLVRDFFRGLVDLSIEFPALAMIVLDNKTQTARRGAQLLGYARDAFLAAGRADDAPGLSVLLTVPSLGGNALFRDVAGALGPHEGVMFDQDDNVAGTLDWLARHGITRTGYGHGIGGIDTDASPVLAAIEQAVAARVVAGSPRWSYIFSPADTLVMTDAMHTGVDGMIVDVHHVSEALTLLGSPPFNAQLRLGTRHDDPFDARWADLPAYTVSITTMDRNDAGTDAVITITLDGTTGSLTNVVNGAYEHRFETADHNVVTLFGDIGTPVAVTLQHDGAGEKSGWLPDDVHVRRHGDPEVRWTSFGEWMYGGDVVHRAVGTTRYRLVVTTADVDNAGTDADILFAIEGTKGIVHKRINAEPRPDDLLERAGRDHVYVSSADVGELVALSITNDGTGNKPGWMVEHVDVYRDLDLGVRFPGHQWLNPGASVRLPRVP